MKAVIVAVMSFLVWLQSLPTVNPLEVGSCQWDMIGAQETHDFDLILEGGDGQFITVHGDCDCGMGLELYVYDDDGNLIGSDTEFQDNLTVWVPAGTAGWITVRVVNSAGEATSFTICVA